MMPYINIILNYMYNNPAVGAAVFIISVFLTGYLIKKMKYIIILVILIMFVAGFYVYNHDNIGTATEDSINKIRNLDPDELKKESDEMRDETKKKFFETFSDL